MEEDSSKSGGDVRKRSSTSSAESEGPVGPGGSSAGNGNSTFFYIIRSELKKSLFNMADSHDQQLGPHAGCPLVLYFLYRRNGEKTSYLHTRYIIYTRFITWPTIYVASICELGLFDI